MAMEHIGTNSMIVDSLTKELLPKVYYEHTTHMGALSLEDI